MEARTPEKRGIYRSRDAGPGGGPQKAFINFANHSAVQWWIHDEYFLAANGVWRVLWGTGSPFVYMWPNNNVACITRHGEPVFSHGGLAAANRNYL